MFLVTQWISGRVGPGSRRLGPKTTAPSGVACPEFTGRPQEEAPGLSWLKRGAAAGGRSGDDPEEPVSASLTYRAEAGIGVAQWFLYSPLGAVFLPGRH